MGNRVKIKYNQIKMNRFSLITTLLLTAIFICTSCDKEEEESTISPYIEGLTIDTYPIIDGSTSTLPLNTVIACELMGLNYQWQETTDKGAITWKYRTPNRKSSKEKV